jgi:prolipoprotein diacylglyceryltransferase
VRYVHSDTLGELGASVHPTAGGYELVGDLVILALLLFVVRRFMKVPGWVFCSYVVMYGSLRFFLSYYRFDEQTIADIPVPQITSAIVVGLAIIAAGIFYRWPGPITAEWARRAWGDEAVVEGDEGPPRRPGRSASPA